MEKGARVTYFSSNWPGHVTRPWSLHRRSHTQYTTWDAQIDQSYGLDAHAAVGDGHLYHDSVHVLNHISTPLFIREDYRD